MRNFTRSKPVCSLPKTNRDSKLVATGSHLYQFSECEQKTSFLKFPDAIKSSNVLPPMLDKRSKFCACILMQKITVIGGKTNHESVNSCVTYDNEINKWTNIASMNENRENTSSTVFCGEIVVAGGSIKKRLGIRAMPSFSTRFLKSVEAYCFHENKWTKFPDMLKNKCGHSTVSIKNKMFVIARYPGGGCEVFDSVTNKFTTKKRNPI